MKTCCERIGNTLDEFGRRIDKEMAKWEAVVRTAISVLAKTQLIQVNRILINAAKMGISEFIGSAFK